MFKFFGGSAAAKLEETQAEMKTAFQEFNRLKKHEKRYTPDFAYLSRRPNHRVFIYNGLMKSISGHEEIDEFGQHLATAFTVNRHELWKKNLGILSMPVALPRIHKLTPALRVKGELWEVTTEGLVDLDFGHENGVQYHRVRVDIQVPYREVLFLKNRWERSRGGAEEPEILSRITSNVTKTHNVSAWMYVGNAEYWGDMLDGGYLMSTVNIFKPNRYDPKQSYYYFSNKEFET